MRGLAGTLSSSRFPGLDGRGRNLREFGDDANGNALVESFEHAKAEVVMAGTAAFAESSELGGDGRVGFVLGTRRHGPECARTDTRGCSHGSYRSTCNTYRKCYSRAMTTNRVPVATLSSLGAAFTEISTEVWCDWSGQYAATNFDGRYHFCQFCGSTDHTSAPARSVVGK